MNKTIQLFLILTLPFISQAQTEIDSLLKVADTHFNNEDYTKSKAVYSKLKKKFNKGSKQYNYVTDQICSALYYQKDILRNEHKYRASIEYLKGFLQYMETEKEYIRPFWIKEQKCVVIMGIIMNYFSLNEYSSAIEYKAKLYKMHHLKELPPDFSESFLFDIFTWKDMNVYGSEYFEKLGDPKNKASFHKIRYDVYSRDKNGNDLDFQYQIQVLKIHNRSEDVKVGDYVLSKLYPSISVEKLGGPNYNYTYDRIIDYSKLKKDLMEMLEEG